MGLTALNAGTNITGLTIRGADLFARVVAVMSQYEQEQLYKTQKYRQDYG
jgi:hypothetical protein